MNEYQQMQASKGMTRWKLQTLLGIFKPRLILIPFAIIGRVNEIPHTGVCFKFKVVFVFGVRVIRIQIGM